ncbi:MAG: glycosyltransferase [Bacteroidota bacterium]
MRIAYITQAYPPVVSGAAVCVDHLAQAMADRGHQVLVIAPSDHGRPYSTCEGNLLLKRFRSYHNPMRARQRFMLFPWRETWQALCGFRPQVIHSHDFLQFGLLALRYAHLKRIPIAVTTHQLPWFVSGQLPALFGLRGSADTALWMFGRWVLSGHDVIISPTQTIADIVMQKTQLSPKAISYGVDLDAFHPAVSTAETDAVRQRLGLPAGVPIILHVGQLHPGKRVDCIIRACAPVLRQTGAWLVIAGDGPQRSALMKMCRGLGIADRVRFTGFITVEEGLPEVYRMASLFTTASEIETQGIVLLEAAASGLPIAAVRATCIPEIVRDGVNGYLAEPGDVDGLSGGILQLLNCPLSAGAMGIQSRLLAQAHDLRFTMNAHEQLYYDLVLERLEQESWTSPALSRSDGRKVIRTAKAAKIAKEFMGEA